jgi:antitoxin component YwqK of YwqJK toxin-antitoxin module
MKRIASFVFIAFVAFGLLGTPSTAFAQALPPCPEDQNLRYHNCFGTYTFANGRKYVGEWKNGLYDGQGTYTSANGDKYVGEYKDGRFHGQGTYTFASGSKYVGEFKDNLSHGQGTLYAANGAVLKEGAWENDKLVRSN